MFRSSNNKVNPSRKEKKQKKEKQEKHKRFLEAQALKEQRRIEQAKNHALLVSMFEPGKFYELRKMQTLRIKSRRRHLQAGTIILFANVQPCEAYRAFYPLRVVSGEDVGEIMVTFEQAKELMSPVDTNKIPG